VAPDLTDLKPRSVDPSVHRQQKSTAPVNLPQSTQGSQRALSTSTILCDQHAPLGTRTRLRSCDVRRANTSTNLFIYLFTGWPNKNRTFFIDTIFLHPLQI